MSPKVTNYEIQRVDTGVIYSTTNLSYTVQGLIPKSAYQFRIRTKYSGFTSSWSNNVNIVTPMSIPAKPAFNNNSFTHDTINLSWNSVEDAEIYEVMETNTGVVKSTSGTNIAFSNMTPSTNYVFKMRAKNTAGYSNWTENYYVTTLNEPKAPTISGINTTDTTCGVSWAEEINAIGYDIERLDTGVIYSTTNLSYSVENLEPKSTYQFRIRTKYNGFNSPWSNSFNATTSVSKPIVPTIENSTFTHTSISLTWDCVEDAETYEVQVVNTGEIVSTTNTNITFNELLSSTEYNYKIRAKNVVGTSIWSNNYSVTTGIEPPESTILLAESNESNMQNIKWDSVARAEGYEIDCNGIVTIINGGNNTNYLNENLVPNITYNYKIRAFNFKW